MRKIFVQALFPLVFLWVAASAGAVPERVSYQGMLNDSGGSPVDGTVAMTFRLYHVASGGPALWAENQNVQVVNGLFSVELGRVVPIPTGIFLADEVFLGVQVGSDAEMTPRQKLASSAFARRAERLTDHGVVPVGAIVAWNKSLAGTPALPPEWVECNGQLLSDPESPYDGQTIPDLNGFTEAPRFLRGAATSGSTGGTETHTHNLNYFNFAGGSGSAQRWLNTNQSLSSSSTLPSYFSVVWIMRIK